MALQGRAGAALGIAAIGSFIAGTVGVVLLKLVSPALARWSLAFGPPETFALMLLGLTTVTLLTGDNALKGYISMTGGIAPPRRQRFFWRLRCPAHCAAPH